jgi:hypothetical protein
MSYLEDKKTHIDKIGPVDKKTHIDKIGLVDKKTHIDEIGLVDKKTHIDEIGPVDKKTHIDEIGITGKKTSVGERLKRIFKLVGILLSTILVPIILSAYQDNTNQWVQNLFSGKETKNTPSTSNQGKLQSDDAILIKLNQLAHNGKIINCDFSLGTNEQVLYKKWGKPDYKAKIGLIEYWDYKERHIIFGVYKNRLIDIRSFDPLLQKFTLKQLEESGEPDIEYDHMNLDQHFTVYKIGKYKLRMVFPKPTKKVPSPNLINISLVDINYSH